MPLVEIRYRATARKKVVAFFLRKQVMAHLLPAMCEKTARQLSCELEEDELGSQTYLLVTPEMVKVRFDKATRRDVRMKAFHVEIEAREFRARAGHEATYATELQATLLPFLPKGTDISVWYKLLHAGWSSGRA